MYEIFFYSKKIQITRFNMHIISFRQALARVTLFSVCLLCLSASVFAQNSKPTSTAAPPVEDTSKVSLLQPVKVKDTSKNSTDQYFTLQQCVDYALLHQPSVNVAQINIQVTHLNNAIALSTALPQINANATLTHYLQQTGPAKTNTVNGVTSVTPYSPASPGYTFFPGAALTQQIFNPSLLYAYKSAPLYIQQVNQITDSTKIAVVSDVTKSFYSLLLTLEQINVLKEDTAEFGKSYRDAYHQYVGGIVDETDYEQAEITLNNTKAQLKQANENVVPQYASLKQLMGFPVEQQFNVVFDTLEMMKNIHIDTNQQLQFEKRIEFQLLNTNKALQQQTVNYYKYSFLPTVSGFFNYNLSYQNDHLSELFSTGYPGSTVGLTLTMPIFTGFSRLNNLHKARLQSQILDWLQTDLKSQINVQYTTALADYKGNYYNLQILEKNVSLAKRVYFVVTLQYRQGIIPYLNVVTAETNLITSEINYLNALFQVLSNKVDLEKAMGTITY
jgi:outer membrane protein TolC